MTWPSSMSVQQINQMIWSQRGFRQDSFDRRAVNRTSAKNEDYLRYQWNECWKCYPNYSHPLACIKRNVFSSSPESVKIFLKKHLFAERRATVCYSNYRVADCKVFFDSPTWRVAERNRAVFIGIGLAETVSLLLLLWWEKSQGYLFRSGRRK